MMEHKCTIIKKHVKYLLVFCILFNIFLLLNKNIFAEKIQNKIENYNEEDSYTTDNEYETKLNEFQNSEEGVSFLKKLSFFENVKDNIVKEKELIDDVIDVINIEEETKYSKELNQWNKFSIKYPKIVEIVNDVRNAAKTVFAENMHIIEELEEIEYIEKVVKKKNEIQEFVHISNDNDINKHSNTDKNKTEKYNLKKNKYKQSEIIKNAIALDNILKIMKSLKSSYSEREYNKIMKNTKLLAEKLIRDDIEINDEQFAKTHFGLSKNYVSNLLTQQNISSSFIPQTAFVQTDTRKKINYCDVYAAECDRRKIINSCERRIPVSNQGSVAVCWVFATLTHLEINHCLASGKDTTYSKQEIIDCTYNCNDTLCTNGGPSSVVFSYLRRMNRIADEEEYQYKHIVQSCPLFLKPSVWTGRFEGNRYVESFDKTFFRNNLAEWVFFIKKQIVTHGSVLWLLNSSAFRFVYSGIIYHCDHVSFVNHFVLATGWTVINNIPVWILRNSWGTGWGDKGYAYVAMNNNCIAGYDAVALVEFSKGLRWYDEINNDEVIKTRRNKNYSLSKKYLQLNQYGWNRIKCPSDEIIHIIESKVYNYRNSLFPEATCPKNFLETLCEKKK